jgi:hypothetical protein
MSSAYGLLSFHHEDGSNEILRNVGELLLDYTALYPEEISLRL